MAISIIPTKIIIPRRAPGVIQRARLLDYLHENLDRKLMLVTAPAGYGKTTLLVDFATDVDLPVCWYTLDEGDRDPTTYLAYLVAALRQKFPQFGTRSQPLVEHGVTSARAAAAAVVADMVDAIPDYFVLILDDWHLVSDEPSVIELIDQILRYLPEHAHVVVAGRTLLRGPLVRLAAQGAVAGLGAADLRFTADEVREVLAAKYGLQVTAEQAAQLAEEAEGWITAIVLTSHTVWQNFLAGLMRARDSAGTVFEYLAGEVFDQLPVSLRDFLCDSAILRQFTAVLCDEIRHQPDSLDWIEQAELRNLFLTRIDALGETWFRYHHLFRDFLVARFKRDNLGRYEQLQRRAGEWFESHQQPEEAVDHYWQAGDTQQAARVMNASARALFLTGRTLTLARWAQLLPSGWRNDAPELILYQAQTLGNRGQLQEALILLQDVQTAFAAQHNDLGLARATLAAGWAYQNAGQVTDALRAGQLTSQRLEEMPTIDWVIYAQATRLVGCAHSAMGHWPEAESFLARALSVQRGLPADGQRSFDLALVLQDLANALRPMGRLEEAASLQSEALGLLRTYGNPASLAHCLNNVGYDRQICGDYENALSMYIEAVLKAEEVEDRRLQAMILDGMASTYRDRGEFDRAMETYARVFTLTGSIADQLLASWALDGLGHAHRLANDFERASALFEQAHSIAVREGFQAQANLSAASIGVTRIEQGDWQGALEIERIAGILRQSNAYLDLGRVLLWLAYGQRVTDQADRSKETLLEMARLGRRLGCRPFSLAEGRHFAGLLTWGVEQRIDEDTLRIWFDELSETTAPALVITPQQAQAPRLTVRAFGPGKVWRDGELLTSSHWGRSYNARDLFFYVLEHSPCSKDDIGVTFWPELSVGRMTSSFHAAKYRARRALGVEFMVYDVDVYRVSTQLMISYDVARFRDLIAMSQRADSEEERIEYLIQTTHLYTGDYLTDVDAEWVIPTRTDLYQQYFWSVDQLLGALLPRARYDEVINVCQHGLEIDYFREILHKALMFSLATTGRSANALRHYETAAKRLATELKATPSPALSSLADQIRSGEPLTSASSLL